MSFLALCADEG